MTTNWHTDSSKTWSTKFLVTVKHDSGTTRFIVWSQSHEAARETIKATEGCPDGSILNVEILAS